MGSLFNLYCPPPPKLIRHVSFQFQPPLQVSIILSPSLNLHLDSAECQMALRWWLGLNTAVGSCCPFCPDTVLGHHAVSCRHGGFMVTWHNFLRDILAGFCHRAHLSVKIEVGYGLSRENINSRPANILVLGQRPPCCF